MFGTSCLTQVLEVWTGTHMVNYTIDRTFIRNVSTTTLQTKWNIHRFVYCLHYLRLIVLLRISKMYHHGKYLHIQLQHHMLLTKCYITSIYTHNFFTRSF